MTYDFYIKTEGGNVYRDSQDFETEAGASLYAEVLHMAYKKGGESNVK